MWGRDVTLPLRHGGDVLRYGRGVYSTLGRAVRKSASEVKQYT